MAAAPEVLYGLAAIAVNLKDLRDSVGTAGNGLATRLALPDTNRLALDGVLATEGAGVPGMLAHFHGLDLLPERGAISAAR